MALKAFRACISAVLFLGYFGLGGRLMALRIAAAWKPVSLDRAELLILYARYSSSRSLAMVERILLIVFGV